MTTTTRTRRTISLVVMTTRTTTQVDLTRASARGGARCRAGAGGVAVEGRSGRRRVEARRRLRRRGEKGQTQLVSDRARAASNLALEAWSLAVDVPIAFRKRTAAARRGGPSPEVGPVRRRTRASRPQGRRGDPAPRARGGRASAAAGAGPSRGRAKAATPSPRTNATSTERAIRWERTLVSGSRSQ